MNPEGSALGTVPAPRTLMLVVKGEGRDLSAVSFLLRAVQEASRALVALLST